MLPCLQHRNDCESWDSFEFGVGSRCTEGVKSRSRTTGVAMLETRTVLLSAPVRVPSCVGCLVCVVGVPELLIREECYSVLPCSVEKLGISTSLGFLAQSPKGFRLVPRQFSSCS